MEGKKGIAVHGWVCINSLFPAYQRPVNHKSNFLNFLKDKYVNDEKLEVCFVYRYEPTANESISFGISKKLIKHFLRT